MEGFSTNRAARLTGVNPKTLHYWDHTGLLTPGVQVAHGTGSRRFYSFRDLVAMRVVHELREQGVSLQGLREVVRFIREMDGVEQPLAERYVVSDGRDVFTCKGGTAISALRQPGQGCLTMILDLGQVVAQFPLEEKELRSVGQVVGEPAHPLEDVGEA
ncbi:MAG: helix-turn-helix domain-containing protein [Acidobacteriaceae bacterium]